MLKNKIKIILVIILAIVLLFMPFVNADLEEDLETTGLSAELGEEYLENKDEIGDDIDNNEDEEHNDDEYDIDEQENEQVKKGDQYLVGDKIEINEEIDGNVYILASDVTINSYVSGNVFVCANTVKITEEGNVANSLYVASSEIKIEGTVDDLYTVSKNINITGYINRDAHIAAESIYLYGNIERDAFIAAKNFSFEKIKDGELETAGIIYGNLNYFSDNEINIPEDVVEGTVKFDKTLEYNYKPNYIFMALSWIALIVIVWLVLKKALPEFENSAAVLLKEKTLKTFGMGLLGFLVVPVISVLLITLVVTVKAGLLLLLAFVLMCIVGETVSIIALNKVLADKYKLDTTSKQLLLLIVISCIAWGLVLIPYAGPVFALIYTATGFGIILSKILLNKENKRA